MFCEEETLLPVRKRSPHFLLRVAESLTDTLQSGGRAETEEKARTKTSFGLQSGAGGSGLDMDLLSSLRTMSPESVDQEYSVSPPQGLSAALGLFQV